MEWTQFLNVLLGGFLALAGSIITTIISIKHSNNEWKKDKKRSVYCQLIQELKTVKIPCLITEEAIYNQQLILDVEELNTKLEKISDFIENHLADIYVFAPPGTYNNLIKLQSKIYTIISNAEYQKIDFKNYKESKIYSVINEAQSISKTLKDDLLK